MLTIKDPKEIELRAIVKMSQVIYSAEDEAAQCTNYPNENYEDYNDCDETVVHNKLKLDFNITSIWVTKDLESVTKLQK